MCWGLGIARSRRGFEDYNRDKPRSRYGKRAPMCFDERRQGEIAGVETASASDFWRLPPTEIFPWIFTLELSDDNVDHRDDYDQAVGLAGLLVVLAATISNVLCITCSSS